MTREQEIQERLGKATPGPWAAIGSPQGDYTIYLVNAQPHPAMRGFTKGVGEIATEEDADFIAHAFADITYLLARVATLEAELNQQFIDQSETVWTRPTAEAYALTCKALTAAQATNAQRDARLFKAGLEAAAKLVDADRETYQKEHGAYDPDTGFTEYPGTGDEWVGDREELAENVRALATDDAAIQEAVQPLDGGG